MKVINKIIKEECLKFLREYEEDVDWELYERRDELMRKMFADFLFNNNENYTKNIYWKLIPFPRLKKIWEDYMRYGFVRDEKGLELIENIAINNTLKIDIFTHLFGHTSQNPDDDYEDNIGNYVDEYLKCYREKPIDKDQLEIDFDNTGKGHKVKDIGERKCNDVTNSYLDRFIEENDIEELSDIELRDKLSEELAEKFSGYYGEDPKSGQAYISDYGLQPLMSLAFQLKKQTKHEEKLVTIDKMLNVVHQRSDIASWFVEGGSRALSQLSGYSDTEEDSTISGSYNMSDYR